jgi:phage tail sheath protein FI
MDRINVARLVVYLRTVLSRIASPFIFEPNDTITRSQVQSAFNSVFNDLVAKRAIYDFLVVCDTTNNTPTIYDPTCGSGSLL